MFGIVYSVKYGGKKSKFLYKEVWIVDREKWQRPAIPMRMPIL